MCEAAAISRKMSESVTEYRRRLDLLMSACWNQYLSDGSEETWQRYRALRDERARADATTTD